MRIERPVGAEVGLLTFEPFSRLMSQYELSASTPLDAPRTFTRYSFIAAQADAAPAASTATSPITVTMENPSSTIRRA